MRRELSAASCGESRGHIIGPRCGIRKQLVMQCVIAARKLLGRLIHPRQILIEPIRSSAHVHTRLLIRQPCGCDYDCDLADCSFCVKTVARHCCNISATASETKPAAKFNSSGV